jgi:hypothetical protein
MAVETSDHETTKTREGAEREGRERRCASFATFVRFRASVIQTPPDDAITSLMSQSVPF